MCLLVVAGPGGPASWARLTFSVGRFVFLLCLAPSGLWWPPSSSLLLPFLVALRSFVFFFLLSCRAPPLSPAFSGFRPRVPWASALCVVCFVGLPLLGSLCAFPSFVLSTWPLAAPWWLLSPPPLCVSRFSSLPLGAVCRVLCCAVCPWVRCCAALLRVVSPGVVLSCAGLLRFARFVPLLVAPCPLALLVALGPCAFAVFPRAVCSVLCVFCRGAVVCAVVRRSALCCVCPRVLCCAFPVLSALCGAVLLLRWCARVVLFVWCVLLLAPGVVVRCCVLCCFLWCAVVRRWVWWPVVVCRWRVSVSVSLSGRVVCFPVVGVVCCGALLSCVVFCGAVLSRGAVLLCSAVVLRCCPGLLCPSVACRAVLCCAVWLAVLSFARWWCLRAVVLFPSCCAFPVLSALCAAVPCCAGCGALLPCVVCCGAVLLCCAVMSCSAVALRCCLCLLCPLAACRAAPCCAVFCCWLSVLFFARWWRLCAVVPFPSLPARTKKTSILLHVTPRWWQCRGWHALVVAVSWT